MAEHGDNNGFDNGFEKVPTADELRSGASFVQDVVHGPPPASSATASDSGAGVCCSWLKEVDPRVIDLIYWRDIKKTGVVFGSLLMLLLSLALFSVLSVISYLSLVTLTVTISYRVYKNIMTAVQKTGEGHPFQQYLDLDISLQTDTVHKFANLFTSNTLCVINELRRLFLVEDMVDSLKFGLLLWILTYVGAWFNGMTLIIIATSMLFSVPKIYDMYKVEIDQFVNAARNRVQNTWNQVKEKIPILAKKKQA